MAIGSRTAEFGRTFPRARASGHASASPGERSVWSPAGLDPTLPGPCPSLPSSAAATSSWPAGQVDGPHTPGDPQCLLPSRVRSSTTTSSAGSPKASSVKTPVAAQGGRPMNGSCRWLRIRAIVLLTILPARDRVARRASFWLRRASVVSARRKTHRGGARRCWRTARGGRSRLRRRSLGVVSPPSSIVTAPARSSHGARGTDAVHRRGLPACRRSRVRGGRRDHVRAGGELVPDRRALG